MFKNVKDWMTNNFLLLNSDKTDILLIGQNKNSTQNLLDYNLQLDGCTVTSSTVKNVGVILDSNLSVENHISCADLSSVATPDKGSKPKKERDQFRIKTVSIEYTYYLFN